METVVQTNLHFTKDLQDEAQRVVISGWPPILTRQKDL
jgi:hypothetical protein